MSTRPFPEILGSVLDDLGRLYDSIERRMDDASWVSSRFIEVLPIDLETKQHCLEDAKSGCADEAGPGTRQFGPKVGCCAPIYTGFTLCGRPELVC